MTIPYRLPPGRDVPGAGFVFLCAVLIASAAFFAWGARTPPLEKEWRQEMQKK